MLISFDGIDGCGKTTLARELYSFISDLGIDAELLDMGSFGFIDEYIQNLKNKKSTITPEIRELLFYFEGHLLSKKVNNNKNKIFITDRFFLTYIAYGPINGIPKSKVLDLISEIIEPDLYFFIDVQPKEALRRISRYRDFDAPEIGYSNTLSIDSKENTSMFIKTQNEIYSNYKEAIKNLNYKVIPIEGERPFNQVFSDIVNITHVTLKQFLDEKQKRENKN